MLEQQEQFPWWQRELNARLARRMLRREARRRLAVQVVGAGAVLALGLLLITALAQNTQGRLAHRARSMHGDAAPAPNTGKTANGSHEQPHSVLVSPGLATTSVTGRFYTSDGRCTFDTVPGTAPIFTMTFPTINFEGRPFTEYSAAAGQPNRVVAQGAAVVGVGRLTNFDAAFTGNLIVQGQGMAAITLLIDDAFNLGLGGGASRVSGTMTNPPSDGLTALERLPVVGAFNHGHLETIKTVTIQFPHPGVYPYEIDYAQCMGGNAALRIITNRQFLATVEPGK
jgi:hypothetical protein